MKLRIHTDAYPERRFEGPITAIDSAVSRHSGGLHLQAEIPNSEALLRAGMYATVEVLQPLISAAQVIPSRAIDFSLYGEQVYLLVETSAVDDVQLSVQQHSIKVAERQGDWSWIKTGLSANDRVVTSGQVRLRNGAQVRLVEDGVIAAAGAVVNSNVGSVADSSANPVVSSANQSLLAVGPGAAARFNIGMVICAGLSIGTLFTLFVLPTIYSYLGAQHKPLAVFEESPRS